MQYEDQVITRPLADAKQIRACADERLAIARNCSQDHLQTVYAPKEGTLHMIFYIDCNGKYLRDFDEHRIGKLAVPCPGPEMCPVCKHIAGLTGWKDAFKYRPSRKSMAYGRIVRHEIPDPFKRRYIKVNVPVLLVSHHGLGDALTAYINSTQEHAGIPGFSGIGAPDCLLKLEFEGYYKPVKITPEFTGTPFVSSLPRTAPPLSRCLWPEDAPVERGKVDRIIAAIDAAYRKSVNIGDSETNTGSNQAESQGNDLSADKSEPARGPGDAEKASWINPIKGDAPLEPNGCPASFGGRPEQFHTICLICPVGEECTEQTKRHRSAPY